MGKATLTMVAGLCGLFAFSAVAPAQALTVPRPAVEQQSPVTLAAVKIKYWRGHRGYRHKRHGYRYHMGFWYPPAAFVIKVKPGRNLHRKHVRWCQNHYASYRKWDNSWKPHYGHRRKCHSPYR